MRLEIIENMRFISVRLVPVRASTASRIDIPSVQSYNIHWSTVNWTEVALSRARESCHAFWDSQLKPSTKSGNSPQSRFGRLGLNEPNREFFSVEKPRNDSRQNGYLRTLLLHDWWECESPKRPVEGDPKAGRRLPTHICVLIRINQRGTTKHSRLLPSRKDFDFLLPHNL